MAAASPWQAPAPSEPHLLAPGTAVGAWTVLRFHNGGTFSEVFVAEHAHGGGAARGQASVIVKSTFPRTPSS